MDRYTWIPRDHNLGETGAIMLYMPRGPRAPIAPLHLVGGYVKTRASGPGRHRPPKSKKPPARENGFAVMIYNTSDSALTTSRRTSGQASWNTCRSEGGMHFARNAINLLAARAVMVGT